MSRALITIAGKQERERAARWLAQAPYGTRLEFKGPKRTLDQNAKMWASLTDIAVQVVWYGKKLTADDWKLVFLDALNRELRIVPNINGTGYVNLSQSSSDLSKEEMSQLIDVMQAFGAQHGVVFHDPESAAPSITPAHPRERASESV